MTVPLSGANSDVGGPIGHTYGAVLVRADHAVSDVVAALRGIRFSGWVAPADQGWIVAVARLGGGTAAAGRRGIVEVGALLAAELATTVLAVRVLLDRQLVLAAWSAGDELGRYSSDPSREPGADETVLTDPLGEEYAEAFAAACGRPDAAEELAEVLGEELDSDSVYESERLAQVLRLLGLPTWLVAAAALPRDLPTGPRSRDLVRLGAGMPGFAGRFLGGAVHVVRRRTTPPPVIADPPTSAGFTIDPWLL
jgi:hypothetical protein